MARRPIMAGNWKMNNLRSDSKILIDGILAGIKDLNESQMPEVIVAPTFTSLSDTLKEDNISQKQMK